MIDIKVDVPRPDLHTLDARFQDFARESGIPVEWAASEQMRLLLQDLISSKIKVPGKAKTGKQAVSQGMVSEVAPIPPDALVFPGENGMMVVVSGTKQFLVPRAKLDPGGGEKGLIDAHEKARRKGRTPKNRRSNWKRGKMTVVDKEFSTQRSFTRARKTRKRSVGQMKRGFVGALRQLDRKVNATSKVPAWVRKAHLKYPKGRVTIRFDHFGHGTLIAYNNVRYSAEKYAPWIDYFMRKRERDVYGPFVKRMDKLIARYTA